MKLLNVYASTSSWNRLIELSMPPAIAYRLLRYVQKVSRDGEAIEHERNHLIRTAVGAGPDDPVTLVPGSSEHQRFMAEFGDFLQTDSDLEPFDMTLDEVVGSLNSGATISVNDLVTLEPFFASAK